MKIAPEAEINDGLLDLLFVKKLSTLRLAKLFLKVFSGAHVNDPAVHYRQVKSLNLVTPSTEQVVMDGEVKGHTPLSIRIIPKKMKLYC